MRNGILFLVFITFSHFSYGVNDSVLFSTDGLYALVKESGCCSYDYRILYNPSNKSRQYFVLTADSAFELTYNERDSIRKFLYLNGNKIYRVINDYSYADFIEKYHLTLKSFLIEGELQLKADTINRFKRTLEDPCFDDTTQFYQISLCWSKSQTPLARDTFTTNLKDYNIYEQVSRYRLYYSTDRVFYFLRGEFIFSEAGCPPGAIITTTFYTRYIGKNEH